MERLAPKALNYDNALPLAIESRANRRSFVPVNGSSFSNSTGATIIRIDVNADSMLDAANSYLQVSLKNDTAVANENLFREIGPAFIQRLRIESGGVTIEDIDEYGRLYTAMMLHQCPEDYVKNVYGNMGLYPKNESINGQIIAAQVGAAGVNASSASQSSAPAFHANGAAAIAAGAIGCATDEIQYHGCFEAYSRGIGQNGLPLASAAANHPLHGVGMQANTRGLGGAIGPGASRVLTIPLLSGFLNMDKYVPLIMMNAGFTIEIHLAATAKVGCNVTEGNAAGGADAASALVAAGPAYSVNSVKYVANLIDLDRSFYDKLRNVMEGSGGVLQLAGQTYRHYGGVLTAGLSTNTITLPARVKSVKSIFGTFISTANKNSAVAYNTGVFEDAELINYRFEVGSVRYPATDVQVQSTTGQSEAYCELHKAFGKLGDYSHSSCVKPKHYTQVLPNHTATPLTLEDNCLQAFMLGHDFEAFQKVALESGINTADRSLPINFICSKTAGDAMTADFYVLSDAIYYINLDGTVSVSV